MIFYVLYNFFIFVISPVFYIAALFHFKSREHLLKQFVTVRRAAKEKKSGALNKKVVVFHAASAGEFEQLKPVLQRMDRSRFYLIQSFFSPTIYRKEHHTDLADAVCYHPFDFIWSAFRFFKKLKPDYYVITRHDIWPNHLRMAKSFNARTILVNANLHEHSFWLKSYIMLFSKWVFGLFDTILTGSGRLKNNLLKIVPESGIIIAGDTRFNRIIDRVNENKTSHLPDCIMDTRNIVFGSFEPSDFRHVFKGLADYYPEGDASLAEKNNRLIIVPHEIQKNQLKRIENELEKLNISFQYYSDLNGNIKANAIIINEVGILADLYSHAELAYVGSGFGTGVHSVIEPAVHGCVTSFGPNIGILDEAVTMHNMKIGIMIKNDSDLYDFLCLFRQTEKLNALKKQTIDFVNRNTANAHHVIDLMFSPD